jgi:hypothetical protein
MARYEQAVLAWPPCVLSKGECLHSEGICEDQLEISPQGAGAGAYPWARILSTT